MAATNQFDDVHGYVTYLACASGFANYAEATAAPATLDMPADQVATYELNANFDYEKYVDPSDEMPVTGAQNGMTLAPSIFCSDALDALVFTWVESVTASRPLTNPFSTHCRTTSSNNRRNTFRKRGFRRRS